MADERTGNISQNIPATKLASTKRRQKTKKKNIQTDQNVPQ
jgi:hypothetical protein